MPSAIVKTIYFDLDKLAWTITAGGNALLQPLTIGQNDTIDFNVQFIKSGAAQTLTSPTFSAGIKVLNGFSNAFVVQFGAPTGTPPTYTFTATISSTELSAALLTGVQFAIEFRDSTNGIVTLPALTLNIVASYTISGTTPTSANGTLNVTAGKTVTFPQSLTFPSALGTNGFQLATDGAGALTWTASGALTDGDKGEITVSNSGAQFTIDNDVITLAKLAHMATARVIGRTTAGNGSPELLTISGTGSVAMTNTPTLVTPVLGAATATSINGITIAAGGSGTLTMEGSINTGALGGSILTNGNLFYSRTGGSINTSSFDFSGGDINTSGNGAAGGSITTSGGGGSIDTTGTGSIGLGIAANRITLVGTTASNGKTATFPNVTGTVAVATPSGTINLALFTTSTSGAPAYRGIATADIATALTTPGAIGGTTASTGAFTTLTGTSSATLGTNLGTGGSLVLRGSTSGSATINTSVTGVLALPSGTTATSMALTTPVLGTPSSGTLTSCTGLPVATGISGLGTGVATALALATNAVGGFATKLYREWNAEEMIAYNSGDVSKGANGSTQQGAMFAPDATNYLKIPLTDMRFAGRTVRLRIICVTNVTEAANLRLFFEVDWRTTALDGATTEPVGVGYATGGGAAETVTKAAPATSLRILSITSTSTWAISSTATYISVAFGRKASAGDDPTNIDNSTSQLCVWSLILEEI
jgi:hypothetical protein